MSSNYVDTKAIIQVIGSIYQNPDLLEDTQYKFHKEDFPQDFHRLLFTSIYNLHALGAKNITVTAIEDYLEQRDKLYGIYKAQNGAEWRSKSVETQI